MKKLYEERRPIVEELLTKHCQFPDCTKPSDDVHEILTRGRGGSIVDRDNLIPLCRAHHEWVTAHPVEAEELGLVRSRYSQISEDSA